MKPPLKIAIAGLGTVGAGTVRLLRQNADLLERRAGRKLVVTAVAARDRARDRGVDLTHLRWERDALALAAAPDVDVVVELIGGSDGIARALVTAALSNGKHVVSANKALLAHEGTALARLAEQNGVALAFEAAVAGGIPILKALREGLAANTVQRIYGILNGTCNYVLTTMRESGRDFADVLGEAQSLGYAEADPSFDIDGIDAAHKLALLAAVAFGTEVDFAGVQVEGIRHVSALDIEFAAELGYRIKLLGLARQTEHGLEQRVHACMVPRSTPIAHVEGVFNAVVVEGDFAGRVMLEGRGAGAEPTASAVVADILDIAAGRGGTSFAVPASQLKRSSAAPIARHRGAYYVRLMVVDRPGVIADIAAALRDEAVSMEQMIQRGRAPGEAVPVVLTTHDTEEAAMRRALERIARLDTVREPPRMIRVENLKETTMTDTAMMDRNLALEAVRVTEAAALSASRLMGRGDEKAADQAAVDAMRQALNALAIEGTVVIGEGERDEAPMLYIGEKVGTGHGPKIDIALDPLEGTTITAKGGSNALAVIAMAEAGGFLNAPDVYMDKIAVGGGLDGVVDLDETPKANLRNLAKAKKLEVADLVVCILDRPRHTELIAKVREAGARIMLISDGDVSGVIATSKADSGVDIYMGSGGAPEGVLAAAALRCIGGFMQARLIFRNDDERHRAQHYGITDFDRKYGLLDLAKGEVMFAATGVTNGTMLEGVRRFAGGAVTHSMVMRSKSGTVRIIEAQHNFQRKTGFPGMDR